MLSMDFFFLGDDGASEKVPGVVLKDGKSKSIFCYILPGRGLDLDWPAEQLVKDLGNLGYNTVTLV